MNYNQALNSTISDKLTKSQLIELSNTLQDHCLVVELEEPTGFALISKGLVQVFKQVKYELPLLIKDIKNSPQFVRELLTIKRD
jgi:hypothetical protein